MLVSCFPHIPLNTIHGAPQSRMFLLHINQPPAHAVPCVCLVKPVASLMLPLQGKGRKEHYVLKRTKKWCKKKIHFLRFVPNALFLVSFKKAEGMELGERVLSCERDSLHNLISGDFMDVPEVPCQKVEFILGKCAPWGKRSKLPHIHCQMLQSSRCLITFYPGS